MFSASVKDVAEDEGDGSLELLCGEEPVEREREREEWVKITVDMSGNGVREVGWEIRLDRPSFYTEKSS